MSASLSLGYFFMLILSKICKLSRDSLQTTMRGLNMELETVISASSKETCRTENVKDKVFCNVDSICMYGELRIIFVAAAVVCYRTLVALDQ